MSPRCTPSDLTMARLRAEPIPEGYRTAPAIGVVVAGLRLKAYSLSKRPTSSSAVVSRADSSDRIGVHRGYWLLHEVQGPARDKERQTNHHEERPPGYRGRVPR